MKTAGRCYTSFSCALPHPALSMVSGFTMAILARSEGNNSPSLFLHALVSVCLRQMTARRFCSPVCRESVSEPGADSLKLPNPGPKSISHTQQAAGDLQIAERNKYPKHECPQGQSSCGLTHHGWHRPWKPTLLDTEPSFAIGWLCNPHTRLCMKGTRCSRYQAAECR